VCLWFVGFGGSKLWAPRVLLVMTHADLDPATSSTSRDKALYEELVQRHTLEVIIEPHVFRLDANQAMGAEMKLLRQTIASIKKLIVEVSDDTKYLNPVYTIQPVVQPAVSCKQTSNRLSNRLSNRFDNRLYSRVGFTVH